MNNQIKQLLGINDSDFKKWCKANKKAAYKKESKKEFLTNVQEGKLVRNSDGLFIKKGE